MEQEFGYAKLDQPGVLQYLFHPRQEAASNPPPGAIDHDIQVDEDISVGARFHLAEASDPNILFFHGNGEIVSDYDNEVLKEGPDWWKRDKNTKNMPAIN